MSKLAGIFVLIIIYCLGQNYLNAQNTDLNGWFKAGSKPEAYDIGVYSEKYNNGSTHYMKSIANVNDGFGTIMKGIEPVAFFGKRIRLTGYIKTDNLDSYAGMWMRIDGKSGEKPLGFDNMFNRQITGTTAWQKYEIVLDVPDNSTMIAYGVLIHGNGQVVINELSFDIVGTDVPTTNMQ